MVIDLPNHGEFTVLYRRTPAKSPFDHLTDGTTSLWLKAGRVDEVDLKTVRSDQVPKTFLRYDDRLWWTPDDAEFEVLA